MHSKEEKKTELFSIPQNTSWHFERTLKPDDKTIDNYVLIQPGASDIVKVLKAYFHHPVTGYNIASIEIVYNEQLNRLFFGQMTTMNRRKGNPKYTPSWKTQAHGTERQQREATYQMLQSVSEAHRDVGVPNMTILPLWHGTSEEVSGHIFNTGYGIFNSDNPQFVTDKGFFGRGVYTAHEAEYSYRCYAQKHGDKAVLLLNWVSLFEAYPIIHGDMPKVEGNPIGYDNCDAHFIPVRSNQHPNTVIYYPCDAGEKAQYTEVVVFNPAQCLPRYRVKLLKSTPAPGIDDVATTTYQMGLDFLGLGQYGQVSNAFEDAEDAGHPGACIRLHWLHSGASGVIPANPQALAKYSVSKKTVEWLKHKANFRGENDQEAQFNLAWCHQQGLGVDINLAKAAQYYWVAASQGHRDAQYQLGVCCSAGIGVQSTMKEAVGYYEKAASQNHTHAHYVLSQCYLLGLGILPNADKAAFHRQAAQKGRHPLLIGQPFVVSGGGVPILTTTNTTTTTLTTTTTKTADQASLLKLESENTQLKNTLAQKESQLTQKESELKQQRDQYQQQKSGLEQEVNQLKQTLFMEKQALLSETQISQNKDKLLLEKDKLLQQQQQQLSVKDQALQSTREQTDKQNQQLQAKEAELQIQKQTVLTVSAEINQKRVALSTKDLENQQLQTQNQQLQTQNQQLQAQIQQLMQKLQMATDAEVGLKRQLSEAEKRVQSSPPIPSPESPSWGGFSGVFTTTTTTTTTTSPSVSKARQPALTFVQQVEAASQAAQGKINQKDLAALLKWVTEGHLVEVEALLKKDPTLGLGTGTVKDRSDRTFTNVTALQYAAWALDAEMAELISGYIGAYNTSIQLNALATEPSRYSVYGTSYDYTPLVTKTQTYVDNYNKWDDDKCCQYWQKELGGEQRKCPAWLIYAWSEEGSDVAWTKKDANRKIKREYEKNRLDWWFTERYNNGSGVGTTWSVVRGGSDGPIRSPSTPLSPYTHSRAIVSQSAVRDRASVSILGKTRGETLQRLRASADSQLNQTTMGFGKGQ